MIYYIRSIFNICILTKLFNLHVKYQKDNVYETKKNHFGYWKH